MMWIIWAVACLCVILVGLYVYSCFMPLIQHPRKGKIHIACIGDSITFGYGVSRTRFLHAWPFVLNRLLGKAYQVLNYGRSSATLQDEGNLPYRSLHFLGRIQKARPTFILLMLGTNDSKLCNWNEKRYRAQYDALVRELMDYPGSSQVILLAPPRAFPQKGASEVAFDIRNEIIANEIHDTVLKTADIYGLPAIDIYELTKDHPEYFMDGVHPNRLGNLEIARHIHAQIIRLKNMYPSIP